MALQNHGYESEYFLDLRTGQIIFRVEEGISEPDEEFESLLEQDPDRFRYIAPVSSSEGWNLMAQFIEQLPRGEERENLASAVGRSHPFRRFKDSLAYYPETRERWFAFENQAMLGVAREWLEDEEIQAELSGVRS